MTIVAWRRSKRVASALQVLRWTGHGVPTAAPQTVADRRGRLGRCTCHQGQRLFCFLSRRLIQRELSRLPQLAHKSAAIASASEITSLC